MSKIALVTGASRGIGAALVGDLIAKGWIVIGVARSKEKLQSLSELYKGRFIPVVCDVSKREEVACVSQRLIGEGKVPSLFFLNAGLAGEVACESADCFYLSKHKELFATNYFGVLSWVEEWLPVCQGQKTTFAVTSSINAIFAPPRGSAYAASKAAIAKAFEGLGITYYNTNLQFAVVYPGPVATEGFKGKVPFIWSAEKMAKYMVGKVLTGKLHIENSTFYPLLTRLLGILPRSFVLRFLGQASEKSDQQS